MRLIGPVALVAAAVGLVGVARAGATTFTFTGAEQAYVVPNGVTEVSISAVGAAGGNGCQGIASQPFSGGQGAELRGDFAVSPGSVLYVDVGGVGTNGEPDVVCTSGSSAGGLTGARASGGAGGAVGGGGGGGASEVLSVPAGVGGQTSALIVAGGGGGAGGNQGVGGNAGNAGGDGSGGGGGGGATLTGPGAAGSVSCGTAPTAGSFGLGGAGDSQSPNDGGGGGGGGYWGGGGGGTGCGQTGSGGGGGSSYVAASATDATTATATGSAASITIIPVAPVPQLGPSGGLAFATQPQGTLSLPQQVTVTAGGTDPLAVTGFQFVGTDPGDFVVESSTCGGTLAVGDRCTLEVAFAPQSQGARTATLVVLSNGPNASLSLSGIGGTLPAGPSGPAGSQGPGGPAGPTGPAGSAGKVEVITCHTVVKKTKGRKHKVTKCTGRLVSGTVKFKTGVAARVTLARGRQVYATGTRVDMGRGTMLLMLNELYAVHPGRYRLTVLAHRRGRSRTSRQTITIGT